MGASAELTVLEDLSSATCSANTILVVPGGSMSPAWEVTEPASESVSVWCQSRDVLGVFCLLNNKVSYKVYDLLKISDFSLSLLFPSLLYKIKPFNPWCFQLAGNLWVLQPFETFPLQDVREKACDVARGKSD